MTIAVQPVGNRIIVKILTEQKTSGGLILPSTAKQKQDRAIVISVGPHLKDKNGNPLDINVNDIILMEKYSGQEITYKETEYQIIRVDDVIAIIKDDK